MTEITEYFDRLLWFIYRVIFTVIPSVVFLCILMGFLIYTDVYEFREIEYFIKSFGFFHWSIVFSIAFCVNLIFESFTNIIVYRILNFYKISIEICNEDKVLLKLLKKYNPEVLENITSENKKIELGPAIFNFGLLKSNSKSIWFNNYVWFLISREFLFCNTSFVILFSSILFIPYSIYYTVGSPDSILSNGNFMVIQVLQLFAAAGIILASKIIIDTNYRVPKSKKENIPKSQAEENLDLELQSEEAESEEIKNEEVGSINFLKENARLNSIYFLVPIFMIVIGIILLFLDYRSFGIFMLFNSAQLLIIPTLFLRAMREFLHVEYLILISFTKDNETKTDSIKI